MSINLGRSEWSGTVVSSLMAITAGSDDEGTEAIRTGLPQWFHCMTVPAIAT